MVGRDNKRSESREFASVASHSIPFISGLSTSERVCSQSRSPHAMPWPFALELSSFACYILTLSDSTGFVQTESGIVDTISLRIELHFHFSESYAATFRTKNTNGGIIVTQIANYENQHAFLMSTLWEVVVSSDISKCCVEYYHFTFVSLYEKRGFGSHAFEIYTTIKVERHKLES
jgi:hypothetical protein